MTDPTGGWGTIVVVALVLGALASIWKIALPLIRIIARLDKAMPKLFEIADTYGDVEKKVADLDVYSHKWRHKYRNRLFALGMRIHLLEKRMEAIDQQPPPLDGLFVEEEDEDDEDQPGK